jgi:hypothetical protein
MCCDWCVVKDEQKRETDMVVNAYGAALLCVFVCRGGLLDSVFVCVCSFVVDVVVTVLVRGLVDEVCGVEDVML